MRKVTKEEFYGPIYRDNLDVSPRITNDKYPYTEDWVFLRQPHRPIYGRTVGRSDGSSDYFLNEQDR